MNSANFTRHAARFVALTVFSALASVGSAQAHQFTGEALDDAALSQVHGGFGEALLGPLMAGTVNTQHVEMEDYSRQLPTLQALLAMANNAPRHGDITVRINEAARSQISMIMPAAAVLTIPVFGMFMLPMLPATSLQNLAQNQPKQQCIKTPC
ncbi:hypothetical protein LNV08_01405 [Paucibacter sp. TC2R-5]|uniref:hypothetical protein n=1 Tax=Paucibacter sp. TC2R-5 TaxID=2893555 RepID=UPI0021E46AC0|nr:hypothetical protein [Paucibacter sp. TC2R-5]MCV2357626.1 hypothetical protein [Paucibacter sp. TC2R-5]